MHAAKVRGKREASSTPRDADVTEQPCVVVELKRATKKAKTAVAVVEDKVLGDTSADKVRDQASTDLPQQATATSAKPPRSVLSFFSKLKRGDGVEAGTAGSERSHRVALATTASKDDNATTTAAIMACRRQCTWHAGLANAGNSCYANAVLQLLRNTPAVNEALSASSMSSASYLSASTTAADASHDTRALQATADAIRELFTIMDERERVAFDSQTDASDVIVVTPERLHGALRSSRHPLFSTPHQQDAAEFLTYLLDAVFPACDNITNTSSGSSVTNLFRGSIVYGTRCMECESVSRRDEDFLTLTLPFPDGAVGCGSDTGTAGCRGTRSAQASAPISGLVSLTYALDRLTAAETIDGKYKYRCEVCRASCEAQRSTKLARLPSILVVHVQRFVSRANGFTSAKITTPLAASEFMSFARWSDGCAGRGRQDYELCGFIVHSGTSISAGHYVAYIKSEQPNTNAAATKSDMAEGRRAPPFVWLRCDDAEVTVVADEEIRQRWLGGYAMPQAHGLDSIYLYLYRDVSRNA